MSKLKNVEKSASYERFSLFIKQSEKIIIPHNILADKRLSMNAKYLFCLFLKDADDRNHFYGNSQNISKYLGLSLATVNRSLKILGKYGYIKPARDFDFPSFMKTKGLSNQGSGVETCSWCEIKTNVIDEHHFPIPKSLGGTEVVKICPNCHAEFHRNTISILVSTEVLK